MGAGINLYKRSNIVNQQQAPEGVGLHRLGEGCLS